MNESTVPDLVEIESEEVEVKLGLAALGHPQRNRAERSHCAVKATDLVHLSVVERSSTTLKYRVYHDIGHIIRSQ